MTITVRISGPLLENGDAIMRQWEQDVADAYGKEGLSEIGQIMNASFKRPTPYYETQVTYDSGGQGGGVLHDRGIVYGPWLEGVGSRNGSSSFKGYHMFRRTLQHLEEDRSIADRMGHELVQRLT